MLLNALNDFENQLRVPVDIQFVWVNVSRESKIRPFPIDNTKPSDSFYLFIFQEPFLPPFFQLWLPSVEFYWRFTL